MAKAFGGGFDVNPPEFSLSAEIFIIRDAEVSFVFFGTDDDGSFRIDARLAKREDGVYIGTRLPYRYEQWKDICYAAITIVQATEKRSGCQVLGTWEQDGSLWKFSGLLKPSRAKPLA
jgi:hypothetical protein